MTADEVLDLCLSLPGAWPDEPWGSGVVPKVGAPPGKVFAFPGEDAVAVKVDPDDALDLRAAHPESAGDAPYLARRHRVRVTLRGSVSDDEVRELVEQSYRLVVATLPRAQRP
ncbi:MAG: hypothetical protein JWN08_869 [Frankiales bacterium]|nr:hypothetical protein [Frankiales bacterium]